MHRIGRTGRAGATGMSFTFFNDNDVLLARDFVDLLEKSNQPIPHELYELAKTCDMKRNKRGKNLSSGVYKDKS